MISRKYSLALICVLALATSSPAKEKHADVVLFGGKVVTLDEEIPMATALAVIEDKIVAVGSDEEISRRIGPKTRAIELNGRLAIPGFIEGHGHFIGLGNSKRILDLSKANTWDDIVRQIRNARRSYPKGQWIIGRGWHQSKWKTPPKPNIDGYPIHTALSEVTPDNPVMLIHASGHMTFANSRAMQLAGVTASTRDPSGGEILRDTTGKPIGVFRETAQTFITAKVHLTNQEDNDIPTAIRLATDECLKKGVTSFQDAGSSFEMIDYYHSMAKRNQLKIRLWVMVRDSNARMATLLPKYRIIGEGNRHLTVRAIKRSIDGALGSHGAWLLTPYEDLASSTGLNTSSVTSIQRTAELAVAHDFQLCVHAIGDRANREVLDIYEAAFNKSPSIESRRWRIEHAQHLHPSEIPRFAKLGVIASMQGIHCTSDAPFVVQRLGQRRAAEGAYAWKSLIKSGAIVINGTDAPVEDVDPLASFHASVTRRLDSGVEFFPKQKMTREQALRSYTIDAAYAAFEEDKKGSLSVGKLADIVVLSRDILTCNDDEIRKTKVDYTIVGGKLHFVRK